MNDVAVDPTEEHPLLNDWSKMHDVPTPDSAGVSMPCQIQPSLLAQSDTCDHKGHYRLVNGMYVAIRICTGCGKSWRLPIRGEYPDEMPDAIWEEIDEPVKWASPVLPDYEG